EMTVRARTGTRIEVTEDRVATVEALLKKVIGEDLQTVISEIGVTPDWSAAYTPNSGPMDAVIKVQLKQEREHSAQEYAHMLRQGLAEEDEFTDLDFAFDTGGMIRGAMNEGKSTPLNVRVTGKDLEKGMKIAERIQHEVRQVDGVVDCRVQQRLDYPQYFMEVDRAKAADLGLTQADVMRNVVAAFNSSIQFNKRNFWIDPVSHNQYYVGVQYPERDIKSLETLLQVPITGPAQTKPIPLGNLITIKRTTVPAELVHTNLQPTIDLTMSVHERDLGHVADDVAEVVGRFGVRTTQAGVVGQTWVPYDPEEPGEVPLSGAK